MKREIEDAKELGIPYCVSDFLSYEPTSTQRVYAQRELRGLEEQGFVSRYGNRIRITAAGRSSLAALPEAATTEGAIP